MDAPPRRSPRHCFAAAPATGKPPGLPALTLALLVSTFPTKAATTTTGLESSTPLLASAFGVRPPGSTSSPGVSNDNSAKTYGYSFTTTTTAPLLVTHLGMFDSQYTSPLVGFYQEHRVGLWTTSGSLLAEVRIAAGTGNALEGMFRYAPLDVPVQLDPATQYVLGAYYPQVATFPIDRLVTNIYWPEAAEGFALGTTRFRFGVNMPFPSSVTVNKPYVGPTLRYQVVPEPAVLLALPAAALIGLRRRRHPRWRTTTS